jgi:Tol biopolymer transport system component
MKTSFAVVLIVVGLAACADDPSETPSGGDDLAPTASATPSPVPSSTQGVIAFWRQEPDGSSAMWAIDPQLGTPAPYAGIPASADDLRWSPDGTRVAYLHRQNGRTAVTVADADGSGERVVYRTSADFTTEVDDLTWSPDSERLATTRTLYVDGGEEVEVMILTVSTGAREIPTDAIPGSQSHPSWAPSGDRLAIYSEGAGLSILELRSQTLTPMPIAGNDAAWSPEGDRLALATVDDSSDHGVIVVDLDGSIEARWSVPSGSPDAWTEAPVWSPDGTQIVFAVSGQNLPSSLVTISADDGRQLAAWEAPSGTLVRSTDWRS